MNDAAVKFDTQDIVVEAILPHPPETIWRRLTTAELVGRWLRMESAGFEPVPGRHFTFQTTPAGAWDGVIRCEVLAAEPNERFAFAWRGGHAANAGYGSLLDTVVTFVLARAGDGTRLRFVQSGFRLPQNETAFRNLGEGWKTVVPSIGAIAEGHG
jgi:uncharacterized protein YndB with AHSA1/START domain